jgi:murein DD-endopeptidase MepM/ murein hydrolase activator NlpD
VVLALAAQLPGGELLFAHTGNRRHDRLEAEIRHKRQQIREANERRAGLLSDIQHADARRDGLTSQIADLAAALRRARGRLEEIRAALADSRELLNRWTHRLSRAQDRLGARRRALGERAAIAYRLGPAGYLDLLLGSSDLRAFTDRVSLTERVLVVNAQTVRGVQVGTRLVARRQHRVEGFRRSLDRQQARVETEVARIEALKAQQEALRAQLDMEIGQRQEMVADVEADKAAYERAVAELQAESDRISGFVNGAGSFGSGSGQLSWPTAGPVVSGFGWRTHPIFGTRRFHAGIDIDGDCGQPISSAARGRVISAGWRGGYGKAAIVDHGDGLSTLYAHQSSIGVSVGEGVARGERIGSVGTTGWSTGCHLHFEVRVNGSPVDPMPYLT